MLEELRIRGLGVIDDAVLPLGPGLTAVTGETGAGKTMVVTGLLLLFGGRGDAARVRTGAEQAAVEGRLRITDPDVVQRVRAAGGELDDDELVLRRSVSAAGRSRAQVGGAAAPVAVLAELGEALLVVHGQADQLHLVRPAAQRAVLDRFAGIDLAPVAAAYRHWRAADDELTERLARAGELRRETGLLEHGIAEIEKVAPQPDEDVDLTRAAARLGHADALEFGARAAHDALLGAGDESGPETVSVTGLLAAAGRPLTQQQGDDSELDALAGRLGELGALAAELGMDLGAYADQLDSDPGRLEQVESRRAELAALARRYCDDPQPSVAGVLRWADAARNRLAVIDVSDDALAALRADRDAAADRLAEQIRLVESARRRAAADLGAAVSAELAGLAMADAQVSVDVRPRPAGGAGPTLTVDGVERGVAADGGDEVEILLQPHRGAPALPIARGASGGELSRVMLALEVCLAGADTVPTLVFDEVDAGVGGRAAVEVGHRLARLARERQVVVVTHLPQVAAFADRHLVVDKPAGSRGGVTVSDVRPVSGDDRVAELARMLAGSDSATALEHARELLADAERRRAVRPRRRARAAKPAAAQR